MDSEHGLLASSVFSSFLTGCCFGKIKMLINWFSDRRGLTVLQKDTGIFMEATEPHMREHVKPALSRIKQEALAFHGEKP